MSKQISAYLAGPEVFFSDAEQLLETSLALCKKYHITPLSPVDNDQKQPPDGLTKEKLAEWIFIKNCDLIKQADIIIANLNPFRGFEPDSGTVFECGFARALQKPGFAFLTDSRPMAERLVTTKKEGQLYCEEGYRVENFGSPLNLMLSGWMTVVEGGLEEALKVASAALYK